MRSHGLCAAAVLIGDGRPVACFGVSKSPNEKERYRYFIVFKAKAGEDRGAAGLETAGKQSPLEADRISTLLVGEKEIWKWQYRFKADEATHKVISESLAFLGKEFKPADARVFLVDLTAKEPTCRALAIAPPAEAPKLAATTDDWIPIVQRGVEELKAKSPELKEFLEQEKPAPQWSVWSLGVRSSGSGEQASGHCCARVVANDNRPIACFGLDKRPQQNSTLTYLMLFKMDPADRPRGLGLMSAGGGIGFGEKRGVCGRGPPGWGQAEVAISV
jgi:hypothetical protein